MGTRLGLGCNRLGELPQGDAEKLIRRAVDLGVTLFDTANVYGAGISEARLGSILAGSAGQYEISTKFGYGPSPYEPNEGASPAAIAAALEGSLRRLRTDRISRYFLHGPDPNTPLEVTLEFLDGLVRCGVVGALGISNLRPWELVHASWMARMKGWRQIDAVQCKLNLRQQRAIDEIIPAARTMNVDVWAIESLQRGNLAVAGVSLPRHLEHAMRVVGHQHGLGLAQVAIAWLSSLEHVDVVLVGTGDPEHLSLAHEAMGVILSNYDLETLELAALNLNT